MRPNVILVAVEDMLYFLYYVVCRARQGVPTRRQNGYELNVVRSKSAEELHSKDLA